MEVKKIFLPESEMPRQWYNIAADMPTPMEPPLNPGTGEPLGPDDLAAILFTSGTTEAPKGVCLTHYNLVANTVQTRHWLGHLAYGKQVCLAAIPLVHSYGMTNAMNIPSGRLRPGLRTSPATSATLVRPPSEMNIMPVTARNVRRFVVRNGANLPGCTDGAPPTM